MKGSTLLFILIASVLAVNAAELDFTGFLDFYQANKIDDHNYNASRLRFRGEISSAFDDAWFFCSVNAMQNNISNDDELKLHECYLEYTSEQWDLRAGRQLIIWGKADGIRITDIVCPLDLSEFITQDFDETRIPQTALKFRYLPLWADLELVWIPDFEAAVLPSQESPWALSNYHAETLSPKSTLENSEIAARISIYSSGFDLSVSALHTFEDTPLIENSNFVFKRRNTVGIEICKTAGDFVFRAESAISPNKALQTESLDIKKHDFYQLLTGCDWNPGNNWNLSAQLAVQHIAEYEAILQNDQYNTMITFNICRTLFRETLELSNTAYYNCNDKDFYNHTEIDYAITDDFHIAAGTDIFSGDNGTYGRYEDKSQYWSKLRYDF